MPNNVRYRWNKASLVRECDYCRKLYIPTHHNQKFCTKKCYKEHRKDYKAKWKREKYQPKPRIGTSNIDGKRNKDFQKEARIIKKEMRTFKLR